jgi:hypothetical protein
MKINPVRSNVFLLQGVAICDIDAKVGQQRLQKLTEKYGQERVIFIDGDVRSYQQLEGDRHLLWCDEKSHDKFIYNINFNIVDNIFYLPP